ncbi:MAG: DUF2812 domain-containing protein [Lachnospiraceae bacterium]|jgi:Protein of unknown function (DUF2812).
MIRFRLYLDKDAKEQWLNQMAAEGWAMETFFAGIYQFTACEKGAYTYRVDFGDRLFSVSNDYRELMQDAGIQIIQTWGYWVILRKKASEGAFALYTDLASSIEHYQKIRRMFRVVTILEMICLFVELYVGAKGIMLGYGCALLIAAMLVAVVNAVFQTNRKIAELEEKMTGISTKHKNTYVSVFLAVGLLINSCAFLLMEYIPHAVTRGLQIIAIAFMLVGVAKTCTKSLF